MKTLTLVSTVALLAFAAPVYAQSVYDSPNGVEQRTAPGGMNNGISAGDQRGLLPDGGYGVREGRASATDYQGGFVNNQNAPGGMNNGVSPALQH